MVAATFSNLSFEVPAGPPGSITGTAVEPFGLVAGGLLEVLEGGTGVQDIVFQTGTSATLGSGNTSPFVLFDAGTLDVRINGGATTTVTFATADFVDITQATSAEVVITLLAQLPGTVSTTAVLGQIFITTVLLGAGASVEVPGGTLAAAFAFPGVVSGIDHFVNFAAATAAEVALYANTQVVDVLFSDNGGYVQAVSNSTPGGGGETACLQFLPGIAATTFGFHTLLACGSSLPGIPLGWGISATATHMEFAEFNTALMWASGYDTVQVGWSLADTDVYVVGVLNLAPFLGGYTSDTVDWHADLFSVPGMTAAIFNTAGSPLPYEPVLYGWPTVAGAAGDVTVIPLLDNVLFNTTNDAYDGVDAEWRGNEDDVYTVPALTYAGFTQGGFGAPYEGMSPVTDVTVEYEVTVALKDEVLIISIQGIDHVYVVGAMDMVTDAADQLALALQNGPLDIGVTVGSGKIQITNNIPIPGPFVTSATSQVPGHLIKVTNGAANPSTTWTGSAKNHFC